MVVVVRLSSGGDGGEGRRERNRHTVAAQYKERKWGAISEVTFNAEGWMEVRQRHMKKSLGKTNHFFNRRFAFHLSILTSQCPKQKHY